MGIGFLAGMALRYPRLAQFVARFGKRIMVGLAIIGLVVAAVLTFNHWLDGVKKTSFNSGFSNAEQQYKAAVEKANLIAANDQAALDQAFQYFGGLATNREQAIQLTVKPQIERITNEVASDPRYRSCTLSDGVFDAANAERAAVDASISASNPRGDR